MLDVEWTVLRPTRFMTSLPFMWRPVLDQGLLLEAGGRGEMSCIDPDDVAAIAVKVLTEDGHAGETYKLTSEDAYNASDLAALLSGILGRDLRVFEGNNNALRQALIANGAPGEHTPAMVRYFAKVASGFYQRTDTVGKILGRAPRRYADWLDQSLSAIRSAAAAKEGIFSQFAQLL